MEEKLQSIFPPWIGFDPLTSSVASSTC